MTNAEIRTAVVEALRAVAPECDPVRIDPRLPLRDQLDLDSMDVMHFLLELDRALHVDVPETDIGQVATLDDCVAYLAARLQPMK